MPYLPTLVRFQNWNKMYPWQLSKIGTCATLVQFYHYWSKPVSTIIGPNQFLPLLVQTSFYHYWSKPVSTITGANQFLPLLVQPVSTIIGADRFLPLLVSSKIGILDSAMVGITRVPFLPILAKNALPVVYSDAHAISTNFGLIFQNWHKMHSLFYRVTHIPFLPI